MSPKRDKLDINQKIETAVDNCIFTIKDGQLSVLLIQMKKKPYEGIWALPGGLVRNKEQLDQAAKRILKDQTGVSNVYLEQLYTFGDLGRDPFGRVISVAYFSLIPSRGIELETTGKYSDVQWWPVGKLPKQMAYDHKKILKYAKQRLEWKVEYSNVVWSLLPNQFTLTEMQKVYEAILGREIDKRNFRKKIQSLGLIKSVGKQAMRGAHRPAMLYSFKEKAPKIVQVLKG